MKSRQNTEACGPDGINYGSSGPKSCGRSLALESNYQIRKLGPGAPTKASYIDPLRPLVLDTFVDSDISMEALLCYFITNIHLNRRVTSKIGFSLKFIVFKNYHSGRLWWQITVV